MQKILLFSEDTALAAHTQSAIEKSLSNPINIAYDTNSLIAHLERKVFHVMVFRFSYLGDYELKQVTVPREAGMNMPIVIIADRVKAQNYGRLGSLNDTHLLISPVSDKSLAGLVRKLMTARRVPKQIFQRFNTNQIAQIESLKSGNQLFTCMYNLSKGGAYCEFDGDDSFTIGDIVRFKVSLTDSTKEHQLNAKIVWTTPKGRSSGRYGCGIKFISSKDTYKSLVSGM